MCLSKNVTIFWGWSQHLSQRPGLKNSRDEVGGDQYLLVAPIALKKGTDCCGWKKSCTTLDGWNPINNGINHLSTGAGFLPSTVGTGTWKWKTDPWKVCCVRRHIDMSWHVRVSFREDPETEGPFLFVCWGLHTGRWSKSSRPDMKEENLWVRHQSTSHDCNTWSIEFDAPSKIQISDEYGNINLYIIIIYTSI